MLLVMLSASFGEWERIAPVAAATLGALNTYSGLSDYAALEDCVEEQRLPRALELARQRFERAPEATAPLSPTEAIRALPKVATMVAVCARYLFEPALFSTIPDFGPLRALSPAIDISHGIVHEYFQQVARGAHWLGWQAARRIHEQVRALSSEQLDARTRYTLELVSLSAACSDDARHAAETTLERCDRLARMQPDSAENYRALYWVATGQLERAQLAWRQCELLTLRSGATDDTRRQRLIVLVELYPLADDPIGLRHLVEELDDYCATRPGWRFKRDRARAHELRCQGRFEEGLSVIGTSLAALPESHYEFLPAAEAQLLLMLQAGQLERACELGARYLESARRLELPAAWLSLALARCLAGLARHDAARFHFESASSEFSERGIGGIHLGYLHEVGARLAHGRGDREELQEHLRACAAQYLPGRYPALAAKHRRLLEDLPIEQLNGGLVGADRSFSGDNALVNDALKACSDRAERAERAIALLCEQTGAIDGVLFGIRGGAPQPLTPSGEVPTALRELARDYLDAELESSAEATMTHADLEAFQSAPGVDHNELCHRPVLLWFVEDSQTSIFGIALLQPDRNTPLRPARSGVVSAIGRALCAAGDVDPVRAAS